MLKEWLGGAPVEPLEPAAACDVPMPVAPAELKNNEHVNGVAAPSSGPVLTEELAAIWKRLCSPRGVAQEFDALKGSILALAGSAGVAEYYQILRTHGVSQPRQFRSMQPARLCAKDVYALLEQLRANARENQSELKLGPETETAGVVTALEVG